MPLRLCNSCQRPTTQAPRCPDCTEQRRQAHDAKYDKHYRKAAKRVRDEARYCALCGQGPRHNDPWQADHVYPDDPNSPLQPAHRSCNFKKRRRLT